MGASRLRAVGTSALRDACNTPEFADLLRRQTGLLLEVLSGEAEALLSYRAVRDDTSLGLPPNDLIVVDIGGGSAEFIHGDAAGIRFRTSLDCGAVRTTERFFHADPPTPAEIAATAQWLDAQLATLPDFPAGAPAVGIGGTFVNLAAVESSAAQEGVASLHGTVLDQTAVARQIARFAAMPTAQRRQIPGLEPKRADVILAGALLVQRILERFALPAIRSVRGLRYGVLWRSGDARPVAPARDGRYPSHRVSAVWAAWLRHSVALPGVCRSARAIGLSRPGCRIAAALRCSLRGLPECPSNRVIAAWMPHRCGAPLLSG